MDQRESGCLLGLVHQDLLKMAEVVIDTLSSAWEWVKKYKEYIAFSVVLVVGVVLCLFPLTSGLGGGSVGNGYILLSQCRFKWRD